MPDFRMNESDVRGPWHVCDICEREYRHREDIESHILAQHPWIRVKFLGVEIILRRSVKYWEESTGNRPKEDSDEK